MVLLSLGMQCHIQNQLLEHLGRACGTANGGSAKTLANFAGKLKVAFCWTLMEFGLGNGLA
jgi:hypothetical protein